MSYPFRQLLHISLIALFFSVAQGSVFAGEYNILCRGIKSTFIEKNCSDNVKRVSKCKLDDFKNYVCNTWSPGMGGPLQKIQINRNYSDYDTRIDLSTENMKKKILRYEHEHEAVSYAWEQWKDLDFILMIQEESLWEEFIFGDNGTSIGYCQINKIYGKELYDAYLSAKDWKERITLCHNHYLKFSHNVGIVFHGWKTRMRNLPSFTFQ